MSESASVNLDFLEKFGLSGVSNIIQGAKPDDVLLLPCKSLQQQECLLDLYLPLDFKGLLLSPFPTGRDCHHIQKTVKEIAEIEKCLIDHFYPLLKGIKIVGVTGTNGKTSVAWLFSEIYKMMNKSALYVGTPGVFVGGEKKEENILTTTPSYLDLRKLMHYYGGDIGAVVLEVSSHALVQNRLSDIYLDAIAWTNFSQDHLDYHKNMGDYFQAKLKIQALSNEKIIIPRQQVELAKRLKDFEMTNSFEGKLEGVPEELERGFSRENLEVALKLVEKLEGPLSKLLAKDIALPPGRMQKIEKNNILFFVDYAHTPDALEKVIHQLKEVYPNRELITVFGCGGDRDKTKRPLMGEVASRLSDKIIITSDNPRSEDPESIIKDIVVGVSKDHLEEPDRLRAIEKAFSAASRGSMILVAGKGHENYQEINGVRKKFDDCEVIRNLS